MLVVKLSSLVCQCGLRGAYKHKPVRTLDTSPASATGGLGLGLDAPIATQDNAGSTLLTQKVDRVVPSELKVPVTHLNIVTASKKLKRRKKSVVLAVYLPTEIMPGNEEAARDTLLSP
jgi:hypothetical protein